MITKIRQTLLFFKAKSSTVSFIILITLLIFELTIFAQPGYFIFYLDNIPGSAVEMSDDGYDARIDGTWKCHNQEGGMYENTHTFSNSVACPNGMNTEMNVETDGYLGGTEVTCNFYSVSMSTFDYYLFSDILDAWACNGEFFQGENTYNDDACYDEMQAVI